LLAGMHPEIAQERLGHSTVTTKLDLYSHVTATMQENAAGRVDAAFQRAMMTIAQRKWTSFGSNFGSNGYLRDD
jgi:hypothetical protein